MTTLTDEQLADLRARIVGSIRLHELTSNGEMQRVQDMRDAVTVLDEAVRLREAFSNCRKWPFHVIPMPFTADGKGPATIGVDAAQIAYEVWDTDYMCHASFDNLPDAINEAMRLTVATLTTEKNDG